MTTLIVRSESLDDFLARAKTTAQQADQGQRLDKSITISFANVLEMAAVLTKERTRILQSVLNSEKSLTELAATLHRDASAVSRDVAKLEKAGLLCSALVANPGHGRHKIVKAAAPRIELSAVLEADTATA